MSYILGFGIIFAIQMRHLAVLIFLVFNLFAYSAEPTTPASNITFPFVGCNEFTMKWTNGNGMERVVFIREASALSDVPEKINIIQKMQFMGRVKILKGIKHIGAFIEGRVIRLQ